MTDSPRGSSPSVQDLLAQLLGGERSLTDMSGDLTDAAKRLGKQGEDLLIDTFDLDDSADGRAKIRQNAKYAGIAGGLALLLNSRSTRKLATLGGLAALGAIAYKGHKRGKMPESFEDAIGLLKGEAADNRAERLLRAMVAAAQADGIITKEEIAIIEAYPGTDAETMNELLRTPPDPVAIAGLATSEQCGAELYAVSARIADGTIPADRDYLDQLAMALGLDPEAAALIETEVRTG